MFKSFGFLLAALIVLLPIRTSSQTVWFKYAGNPVMDVGVEWESRAAAVTRVMFEDSLFKMWYIGYDGTAGFLHMVTGYATSRDGITWTKQGTQPALSYGPSLWDGSVASDGYVVRTSTGYNMWYFGQQGSIRRIGYARSPDGILWTKYPNNPLLDVGPPGTWDERALIYPCVLGPDSVGGYKMWFYGFDGTFGLPQRIGYATAVNESTWTKYANNPVLTVGQSGSWDGVHVGYPRVMFEDGLYKMWYSGSTFQSVGYATSPDGINWTKWPENPVFSGGPIGSWDAVRVHAGDVIPRGGVYWMWYWGFDGSNFRTGLAVSPKGMTLSISSGQPMIGDTVWVTAEVDSPAGLSFSAEIRKPEGNIVGTAELHDGGLNGDSVANDGIFVGNWVPMQTGSYVVDVKLEIRQQDLSPRFEMKNAMMVSVSTTSVPGAAGPPVNFELFQNYPNPFNPTTAISYQLSAVSSVSLKIFDILVREVAVLVNEEVRPGTYETTWDAAGFPGGVYLYRLQAGNYSETRKLVLTP